MKKMLVLIGLLAVLLTACSSPSHSPEPSSPPSNPTPPPVQPPSNPLERLPVAKYVTLQLSNDWTASLGTAPESSNWEYKDGQWNCGAVAFKWETGTRTLADLDPTGSSSPLARRLTVRGDTRAYPGLLVQGGEGTGIGSSGFWSLYVGGSEAWVRVTCGGPVGADTYAKMKGIIEPLLESTKVTNLGEPVE
jgi:hypothetical protein